MREWENTHKRALLHSLYRSLFIAFTSASPDKTNTRSGSPFHPPPDTLFPLPIHIYNLPPAPAPAPASTSLLIDLGLGIIFIIHILNLLKPPRDQTYHDLQPSAQSYSIPAQRRARARGPILKKISTLLRVGCYSFFLAFLLSTS